ncbi:MAG: DUF2357 domain-containing protein [Christensenellales bacterium]
MDAVDTNNNISDTVTDDENSLSRNAYDDTARNLSFLSRHPYYGKIMECFRNGEGTVELRRRFMLKAIDETWVRMIEDTVPSLDAILRNPGRLLCEDEELRPIEQTRKVTSRSIQHLSQHTDLINEIRRDGTVMPSKLLNVYQDETILTYENKFINTLIARLYAFVCLRVDAAEQCGADEKLSTLTIGQEFSDGDKQGRISLKIEMSESPEEHAVVKNYVYSGDLWKRVLRLRKLVTIYADSSFSQAMGKNYVRPPVMRTNMLLKNVDFRQCLTLWEFLETYENTGYETLVQESLEKVSPECTDDFFKSLAEQYVLFLNHVGNRFEKGNELDSRTTEEPLHPKIKEELDPLSEREYDYADLVADGKPDDKDAEEKSDTLELAIKVALAADDFFVAEERDAYEQEAESGKIRYRYRYSFLSRLILAQNPTQDFYTEIKNHLLSYKKVKSRISWNHEAFSAGRKKCARINVKGKTLFLYLPIDAETADKKYRLIGSESGREQALTSLLKVRSERGVKYAKELIDAVMSNLGLEKIAEPVRTDYRIPYATREEMAALQPPLVKVIGDEAVVAEVVQSGKENAAESGATDETEGMTVKYRYRYSFRARLIQSGEKLQTYYGEIKNYLLAFGKVKSNVAWAHDGFRHGRNTVAKIKIRGKSLLLYLALSPEDYVDSKYHVRDLSRGDNIPALPVLLKVRSGRGVKYAKELIDDVMKKEGAVFQSLPSVDYRCDYMTTEELTALPVPLVKSVNAGGSVDLHKSGGEDEEK